MLLMIGMLLRVRLASWHYFSVKGPAVEAIGVRAMAIFNQQRGLLNHNKRKLVIQSNIMFIM